MWKFGRRRRRRAPRIDPFGVGEPWRQLVQGALQARARYQRAVSGVPPGPLRERLGDIARRVDEVTQECWRLAQRGDALADAASTLGPGEPKVRLTAMVADAQEHLGRIEAGLDRAVAGAVELSARLAAATHATDPGNDIEHLVEELTSVRAALDEMTAPDA